MKFKLYSNCISVKGFSRSVIYDLQRRKYEFIPNDLAEILHSFNGKTINEIKSKFHFRENKAIDEYFEFLKEKEFIFETEEPCLFPDIDTTYDTPSTISNVIIEVNQNSDHHYEYIFTQLDEMICQAAEIRFFKTTSLDIVNAALFPTRLGKLRSIELLLEYSESITIENLQKIFKHNLRISRICIHSAPFREVKFVDPNNQIPILFSMHKIEEGNSDQKIRPEYFVCSLEYYIEAINYNTYFNKKVVICSDGSIKNCSSLNESFGNVKTHSLKEVIQKDDFRKLWSIKKDLIKVCKDCEYRYMCTDSRVPVLNERGEYVHTTDCNYDPYTMTWS